MLRGVVRWSAAVLAGVALATGVPAQGVNPSSTENVVPAAAGLESERQALFQQMFRDPSNLDIAFRYAELSVRAGDLEAAIATLERMLVYAPGLPRLQFELGVLYFRLGAYETAATYLRAVEAASDVPPDVRSQVGLYLAEIEERASGSVLGGSIAVGVRYQTNANAGPGSPNIDLFGRTFLLSPNALSQPDANGFVVGRFNASIDLKSQGDRFDIALSAYGAIYHQLNTLNTGIVELRAGPTFNLQRFSIENATLGLHAIVGGGMLGGAPYIATLGVGSNLQFVLDARSRVRIKGEAVYEQYYDSALRPTASLRSGQRYSAEFGYDYQLTQDIGLFLTLSADRRLAQRGYLSNWQVGAEAGVAIKVPSPIEVLTQPWTVGLSAGVQHQRSDAPDPVFSATAVEDTTRVFAQGTLTVPLPNAFAFQANAIYMRSMSNYGLSAFDNFAISAAISKGF